MKSIFERNEFNLFLIRSLPSIILDSLTPFPREFDCSLVSLRTRITKKDLETTFFPDFSFIKMITRSRIPHSSHLLRALR